MSQEPIKAGDLAHVVKEGPNHGLVVRVLRYVGDHSQHGRIWRCEAEFAELAQPGVDVPPGTADFAQAWLRKIPGPSAKTKEKEHENV